MGRRRKTKNRVPREVAETVRSRAQGFCEGMIREAGCNGQAEHLHHRQMRSQGGQHTVQNILSLCHLCHTYVHMHPAISYTEGFLVKSHGNPATAPVKRRGGFTLLTEEGGFNDPETT